MIPKILHVGLFVGLCAFTGFAQLAADSKTQPSDDKDSLEKQAVAFLRETASDVNTMRTAENRISFSAELASLMWLHDEKEARAMYNSVFAEFRNLLIGYNKELNELPASDDDAASTPGLMSFLSEPTDRARIVRKFTMAMAVRQQIVLSLAEHDPDLAVALYEDTLVFVSNAELRKQIESGDTYFQTQLIAQISE
jgi:hypothetical protein